MKTTTHDEDFALGHPHGSLETTNHEYGEESFYTTDGNYYSNHGIVNIYQSEFFDKGRYIPFASFSIVIQGRGYYRNITGKAYTHIGLARKAGEFVKDLVDRGVIVKHQKETV